MTIATSSTGRLTARPSTGPVNPAARHGIIALAQGVLLQVPPNYRRSAPAPLAVMLHGAGADALQGTRLLTPQADAAGMLVLATTSHGRTWDLLLGRLGPDVAELDTMLTTVFERYSIDPARLAIGGFSDGASYALSLGLANGDLFSHVLAFSPGYSDPPELVGMPRVFVSHGRDDAILPIERTSRRIVPVLQEAGYQVDYREFDGGHTVPAEIRRDAVEAVMVVARR